MPRRTVPLFAALFVLIATLLGGPAAVSAITYGFVDSNNTYSNVGALMVQSAGGKNYPICSGTLISSTVFLTASHCTVYYTGELAPLGYTLYVSFDGSIPFGDSTSRNTNLVPVTQVVSNPNYPGAENDPYDIAVVLIKPNSKTRRITPATLPLAGQLDALAAGNGLKGSVFTAVGYGVQDRVVSGGPPTFTDANPVPRMYAFSSFDALGPGYLRLSQNPATGNGGTCYGDSGGPNFLNAAGRPVLMAITITGDSVCRSTNVDYRLDIASARAFLAPYVTLP